MPLLLLLGYDPLLQRCLGYAQFDVFYRHWLYQPILKIQLDYGYLC
jgi:hypothetical protein